MPENENGRRESDWNACDAHARYVSDEGHETVVVCDNERHAAPLDTDAVHHDPKLGINWSYDDSEIRFDDD